VVHREITPEAYAVALDRAVTVPADPAALRGGDVAREWESVVGAELHHRVRERPFEDDLLGVVEDVVAVVVPDGDLEGVGEFADPLFGWLRLLDPADQTRFLRNLEGEVGVVEGVLGEQCRVRRVRVGVAREVPDEALRGLEVADVGAVGGVDADDLLRTGVDSRRTGSAGRSDRLRSPRR
jgi:hypothetical protein